MRFDDHRGLIPSRMRWSNASLRGVLVRTKTTGAGKKWELLHFCVDELAYLVAPDWLAVGWALWQEVDQARDDFLVLPSSVFSSWVKAESRYADSVACGRALFQRLADTAGLNGLRSLAAGQVA